MTSVAGMRALAISSPPLLRTALDERCRPEVLVDDEGGDGPGLHRRGRLGDVVVAEEAGLGSGEVLEAAPDRQRVGQLDALHRAVDVLADDEQVEEPDDLPLDEVDQGRRRPPR